MDEQLNLYQSWSPSGSPWTAWVKPVLFAHLPFVSTAEVAPETPLPDLGWVAARPEPAAVVLDLPGADSVRAGVQLAGLGPFQPIPLYASCPSDHPAETQAVSTTATLRALQGLAAAVAALPGVPGRRPVFLLDSHRGDPHGFAREDEIFDNRSAVFSSDFPPAEILRARGIQACLVIRSSSTPVDHDLVVALAPWRKAGIRLELRTLDGAPVDYAWPRLGFLSSLFFRAKVMFSLKANASGGFGRYVDASAGG